MAPNHVANHVKVTTTRLILGALCLLAIGAIAAAWLLSRSYRPVALKSRIEALLGEQLESEVTIGSLEGSFFPRVSLHGGGLVVRHHGRSDVPPLVSIGKFEIRASLSDLMGTPRHVSEVRLSGLQVHIPPSDDQDEKQARPKEQDTSGAFRDVVIDRFEAPDTLLTLIPRKPNKPPKVFTIHHLIMDSVGRGRTIPYIAVLTNPTPKGDIETSGTLGPWNVAHPARTPVAGRYTFTNADLSTIHGLSGILSSVGTFDGLLNRIHVQGTTDTPKFQVDAGGRPVPLTTKFTALVDGSDGDTILERVDAKFFETDLTAKGAVTGLQGVPGRRVEVDVTVQKGRIEDLLRLAVDSAKPVLRGTVQLHARLVIPPRHAKVLDKMTLKGTFGLSQAKFTDATVQSKIIGLSRHGQGKTQDEPVDDVLSDLRGTFVIDNGVATFPELKFGVPGAAVDLAGTYAMRSQKIDFRGHLVMDATLSQAAGGGLKSFFLKAVDPFFRKGKAGTVLPIKITGNRKDPKFGLNLFDKSKKQ